MAIDCGAARAVSPLLRVEQAQGNLEHCWNGLRVAVLAVDGGLSTL